MYKECLNVNAVMCAVSTNKLHKPFILVLLNAFACFYYVAPIQTHIIIIQAPIITAQAPISIAQESIIKIKASIVTTQAPIINTQTPIVTTQASIMISQQPIILYTWLSFLQRTEILCFQELVRWNMGDILFAIFFIVILFY